MLQKKALNRLGPLKDAFKNKDIDYSFVDYKNAVLEYKNTQSKVRKREVLQIINEVKNNFKSTLDDTFIAKFQKAQGQFVNEQERQNNLKVFDDNLPLTNLPFNKKFKA